jgi:hypothetical protein
VNKLTSPLEIFVEKNISTNEIWSEQMYILQRMSNNISQELNNKKAKSQKELPSPSQSLSPTADDKAQVLI